MGLQGGRGHVGILHCKDKNVKGKGRKGHGARKEAHIARAAALQVRRTKAIKDTQKASTLLHFNIDPTRGMTILCKVPQPIHCCHQTPGGGTPVATPGPSTHLRLVSDEISVPQGMTPS